MLRKITAVTLVASSSAINDAVVCVMNASGLLNEDTALFGVERTFYPEGVDNAGPY